MESKQIFSVLKILGLGLASFVVVFVIGFMIFYHEQLFRGFTFKGFFTNIKVFCTITKGDWIETGCGVAGCQHSCFYAYSDAGKSCKNSEDCLGNCIVVSPKMGSVLGKYEPAELKNCQKIGQGKYNCQNENFIATCEKTKPGNCEPVWLYDNGVITDYSLFSCKI